MTRPATWFMDGTEIPYMTPSDDSERDIELPWANAWLSAVKGPVLEVGNTTQERYPDLPRRDIVCRYDVAGGPLPVRREDILTFKLSHWVSGYGGYRLILSVSTLEHIGKDYSEPTDPERAIRAAEHCMNLLAPGGEFVGTIPCGYHERLQEWLDAQSLADPQHWGLRLMVRQNADGWWQQRPLHEAADLHYPHPYKGAPGVLFFRYTKLTALPLGDCLC